MTELRTIKQLANSWSSSMLGAQPMTKIPSIEKTEDFIYRLEIKRGTPLHDPNVPHLLAFETIYRIRRGISFNGRYNFKRWTARE